MAMPPSRRFVFVAGFAATLTPSGRALARCAPVSVLFVCPAGTVKSAIARETLRRMARERALALVVRSRGVAVEDHVSPQLAARLRADGTDPASEPALRLQAGDAAAADIVIAFDDAKSAPGLEHARAWATPSWNSSYDAAKADLSVRLSLLLNEIERLGCVGRETAR